MVAEFLTASKTQFDSKYKKQVDPEHNIDSFELIRTLGTGSFGRVMLSKRSKRPSTMRSKSWRSKRSSNSSRWSTR